MATTTAWSFEQNPILHATDNSYRLAVRISTYHDGALKTQSLTDPTFVPIYNAYHILHLDLIAKYDALVAQDGLQQGETLNVTQLLRLLSGTKCKAWDISVQNVYNATTPRYMALFPNHRTPFQHGSQTDRINAVHALSVAIGTDVPLAAVKIDVDGFHTTINNALTTQKGSIASTNTFSDAMETSRVAMCVGQFGDLGWLIQKYAATPHNINQYFDLAAIRSGNQVLFVGHVKKQSTHTIVKHTFGATDSVKLENPGVTDLQFYLAQTKGAHPGATFITVAAGAQQTVLASALGPLTDTYLMAFNPDAVNEGEFTVEFI